MQASFLLRRSERFAASLDARLKLLLCAGVSVATIAFSSAWSLMLLLAGATALALSATTLRMIVLVWLASSGMMLMTTGFSWLLSLAVPGMFTWDVLRMSVPYLRMLVVVMLLLSLALSTPVQVVIEKLNAARLPGVLSTPLGVAIRFIPTFIHDVKQVTESLKMRGYRLNPWTITRHPARSMRLLLTPLLFRSLRTSEDLGVAAELKGLGMGEKLTPYRKRAWTSRDSLLLAAALLVVTGAIACQYTLGGTTLGGMR